MAILLGSKAPDFALPGWYHQKQSEFALSSQRGQTIVLAFYPGDERLICTRQLCAYSDNIADLHRFDSVVWGISPQGIESHRQFSEGKHLKMPLLSDEKKSVASAYGIMGAFGLRRSVFVVNSEGKIAWRWVSTTNVTFPSVADIKQALTESQAA